MFFFKVYSVGVYIDKETSNININTLVCNKYCKQLLKIIINGLQGRNELSVTSYNKMKNKNKPDVKKTYDFLPKFT